MAPRLCDVCTLIADTEAATEAIGRGLLACLSRGALVTLDADLGTGKTALARGLIRASLHEDAAVPSPTFALIQPYDGDPPVLHVDLYRLEAPEEVMELGIDDALDRSVVLVEWPARGEGWLPPSLMQIKGMIGADGARRWTIYGALEEAETIRETMARTGLMEAPR